MLRFVHRNLLGDMRQQLQQRLLRMLRELLRQLLGHLHRLVLQRLLLGLSGMRRRVPVVMRRAVHGMHLWVRELVQRDVQHDMLRDLRQRLLRLLRVGLNDRDGALLETNDRKGEE